MKHVPRASLVCAGHHPKPSRLDKPRGSGFLLKSFLFQKKEDCLSATRKPDVGYVSGNSAARASGSAFRVRVENLRSWVRHSKLVGRLAENFPPGRLSASSKQENHELS